MSVVHTVTATLNGCTATATTTPIINAIPTTPLAGSNAPICEGTTLNLTANTIPVLHTHGVVLQAITQQNKILHVQMRPPQ